MFSLQRDETAVEGLARVMRETIDRAAEELADQQADLPTRVHEARKRLKEVRAILRLARPALGEEFAVQNARFRDAGQQLAAAREAEALIERVLALRKSAHDPVERRALSRALRLLTADRDAAVEDLGARLGEVDRQLSAARERLPEWEGVDGDRLLRRGLRRTYRDGRRALRVAQVTRAAADIHRWRKRVKDLWYHAQLMEAAWPAVMKCHSAVLHDLSRLLGEHHDLADLRTRVATQRRRFGPRTAPRIEAVVTRRREEIEATVFTLGALVHAESPRSWSNRLVGYWSVWRAGAGALSSAPHETPTP
jgi:CHAD domain-containing protein